MSCPHPETFECHGTQRCSACYMDSYLLHDGTRVWPSQEHPDDWDDNRVAQWFLDNRIYNLNQGCDGVTFCRNNTVRPATYGYVWIEVVLDLDYLMAYMLDVRRHDGHDETRRYIFVGDGQTSPVVASHASIPWRTEGNRLVPGLHWFAEQVDLWLQKERN